MQHKLCFFLGELLKLGITNMVHWCTGAGSRRLVELGLCYPWGRQSPLVGYRFSPGWDSSKRNHFAKESVPSANFIGKSSLPWSTIAQGLDGSSPFVADVFPPEVPKIPFITPSGPWKRQQTASIFWWTNIWRFQKWGYPLNHPFIDGFSLK